MRLGRRGTEHGEALPLLPDSKDSASEKWRRHYIWSAYGDLGCDYCWVGEVAEDSHFCPEGLELRQAALAEMKAIPKPVKKPTSTVFNPSIEGYRA
jgi:hypothetical protein